MTITEFTPVGKQASKRSIAASSRRVTVRNWRKPATPALGQGLASGYSARRNATRSDFSCVVNPMLNRVS